jgi:hypothetical protein
MGEHPLNREVGLAGIGRAEDGANPGFEHAGVNVQKKNAGFRGMTRRACPWWHHAAG